MVSAERLERGEFTPLLLSGDLLHVRQVVREGLAKPAFISYGSRVAAEFCDVNSRFCPSRSSFDDSADFRDRLQIKGTRVQGGSVEIYVIF